MDLLEQLELEQSELGGSLEDFLTLHMYITSAPGGDNFKTLMLKVLTLAFFSVSRLYFILCILFLFIICLSLFQLALDMAHKKEQKDQLTGLRTRTKAGRPDWDQVYIYIHCIRNILIFLK